MALLSTLLLRDLPSIRTHSPIVLNLTNFVAMDFTANALLAIGASPIMAHEPQELSDLIKISKAVVINIGTLDEKFLASIKFALKEAEEWNKPVILDPVGAGASELRTKVSQEILHHKALKVVRGNASEIAALLNLNKATTRGVESSLSPKHVIERIKQEAQEKDVVFVVSGQVDYVVFKKESTSIIGGDPLMTKVTAMGCVATSIIGAFLAVNSDAFEACKHAMSTMAIVGERAGIKSSGPGSFRMEFLDALANLV